MRLARQVVVGFGGRDIPGPRQLELLRALARVLDELAAEGVDLSGAHIMLGPRTAMDSRGTLWLDASEEDHEAWADFLGGADLAFASARRAAAAGVRRLEEGAAAAAGLAAVFSPAALVMAPEYRTFLERLAKHAADHGPIRSKGGSGGGASSSGGAGSGAGAAGQQQAAAALPFSEVPLYVAPYGSGSAGAGGGSEASSSGGGGGGESSGGGGFDHDVAAHLMFTSSVITDPPPRRAQKFKVRV
ncbi:MAG: hypothetical protein J3K34DRAFT_233971 [Monoraphidium minutum]|nr:MAG: hypothetical protein J3K34DRAFT_233971 [Monoraphidium minutum]